MKEECRVTGAVLRKQPSVDTCPLWCGVTRERLASLEVSLWCLQPAVLLSPPQFVMAHVPAALDLQPFTAEPASLPRLSIKATACQAVERASTLPTGSAKVQLISLLLLTLNHKGLGRLFRANIAFQYNLSSPVS